jgi:hypothetical protein
MELPSFGSPSLHPAKAQSKHNNNVKMQSFLNIRVPPVFLLHPLYNQKRKIPHGFLVFLKKVF